MNCVCVFADYRRGTCYLRPPTPAGRCPGEVGDGMTRATCCCTVGGSWAVDRFQCQPCPRNDTRMCLHYLFHCQCDCCCQWQCHCQCHNHSQCCPRNDTRMCLHCHATVTAVDSVSFTVTVSTVLGMRILLLLLFGHFCSTKIAWCHMCLHCHCHSQCHCHC